MDDLSGKESLASFFNPKVRQLATNEYHFDAGWYEDPWGSSSQVERFWTGRNWSDEIRQKSQLS